MKIKQLSARLLCCLATITAQVSAAGGPLQLLVGTYTGGDSEGLYLADFNPDTRQFSPPRLLAAEDSPSFLALDRAALRLYTVSETEQGQVSAYQWQPGSRQLTLLNRVSSRGSYPCYIALSPDRNHLAVANYGSGNLAVYPLDAAGAIGTTPRVFQHRGRGADPQRQTGPHAHWVQWDAGGRLIYAVDLGIDQVRAYEANPHNGALERGSTAIRLAPGSGPRHMVLHPGGKLAYILNELANTVVVAGVDAGGGLVPLQTVSTLPDGYHGPSQAAHIYLTDDGKYLYTSNRGHNSIAVFAVADNGRLQLQQTFSSQGDWPRHFAVLERRKLLLVANQRSNRIAVLQIGAEGTLSFDGTAMDIETPVFLAPWFL